MTQPIVNFDVYLEEFKDESQRMETVSQLVALVYKKAQDLLSDTRQQLSYQFEQFLKQLIYSKVPHQQLAAIDIIINLLNTYNPILQLNLLEPYVLQLCNFKQTCFYAAHLIPLLYNINKQVNLLNQAWEQVDLKFYSGTTKVQAAAILTHICHLDVEKAANYVKQAWDSQYIECYCYLLLCDLGLDFLISQLPKPQAIQILRHYLLKIQIAPKTHLSFNERYESILELLLERPRNVDIFGLLSRFNAQIFTKYLGRVLQLLLQQNDLAEVATIVGTLGEAAIRPHFDVIFKAISASNFSASALTCVRALAQNCNALLHDNFAGISPYIFKYGLTHELIKTLQALRIPELETKLLQIVAVVLSGVAQFGVNYDFYGPCSTRIDLALKALISFDFQMHDLTNFCCDHVVKFLTHENKDVRKTAGQAIIKHIKPNHFNPCISQVITQVLILMLTDAHYDVRVGISAMLAGKNAEREVTRRATLRNSTLDPKDEIYAAHTLLANYSFQVPSSSFGGYGGYGGYGGSSGVVGTISSPERASAGSSGSGSFGTLNSTTCAASIPNGGTIANARDAEIVESIVQSGYLMKSHATAAVNELPDHSVTEKPTDALEFARFDDVLAYQENVEILFISISDQSFAVRTNVFKIIGRISKLNPTIVLPKVRQIFLNLVFELNYQKLSKNIRQYSLYLMNILVSSCYDLIQPFYPSACSTLFKILDGSDDIEIELALSIMQKLFYSDEILQQLPRVVNYLELFVQSKNDKVRRQALFTLKDIVITTGLPIIPFVINSTLIEQLINIIKNDQQNSQLAIKTFVTVGALDEQLSVKIPEDLYMKFGIVLQKQAEQSDIISHGHVQYDPITNAIIDTNEVIKKYYYVRQPVYESDLSLLIFNTIIDILDTNENQEIQYYAIILLRKEIKTLDANSSTIKRVINSLLALLERTDKLEFKELLLKELVIIVSFLEKKIQPYSHYIINALFKQFENQELLVVIFTAIEEIISKLPDVNFIYRNDQFVYKLLELYSSDSSNEKIIIKSFSTLVLLMPSMSNQVTLLIPSLLKLVKKDNKILQLATLDAIGRIVSISNVVPLASLLINTLLALMKETARGIVNTYQGNTAGANKIGFKAFRTLQLSACSLGRFFCPFIPVVNQYIVEYQYYSLFFDAYLTILLNGIVLSEKTAVLFFQAFYKNQKPLDDFTQDIIKCDVPAPQCCGTSAAALCVQMYNFPSPSQAQLLSPAEFGVVSLHIQQLYIDNIDAIPQKDWICDDQNDPDKWRRWMRNFSLSAIYHSPDPKIHDCYELARQVPALSKVLFNYAFLSFVSQNNVTELKKTAQYTLQSVFSSAVIPQDIYQYFLDLIEFLEHNQIATSSIYSGGALGGASGALDCDYFGLAKISDRCFAYARSLRFKEQNYIKSYTRQALEALVNANAQLRQFESIRGLIYMEQEKANNTCVSTILSIIARQTGQLTHYIKNCGEPAGYYTNEAELLEKCYKLLAGMHSDDRKLFSVTVQSQEANQFSGAIAGIFLEGREVSSHFFSTVMSIESKKVAYFFKLFTAIQLEGLGISSNAKEKLVAMIIQNILQLSDLFQLQFGLKPKYYEYIYQYDFALEKYYFYIDVLYKLICYKDISRLSSQLKSHQYLCTQYIQCLFNLGKFEEVLAQSDVYLTTEFPVDKNVLQYNREHFSQCVASYCTQSAYETNNHAKFDAWIYLVSDPERSIFLILKCIQDYNYELAKQLLDKLFDRYHPLVMAGIFESYQRAQPQLLLLQNLNEIEEAVNYKLLSDPEAKRLMKNKLRQIWQIRLQNTGHSYYYLKIRELVFDLSEDYSIYLNYAQDCIYQRKYGIARQIYDLLDHREIENCEIQLAKAYFEHKIGNSAVSYDLIDKIIKNPSTDPKIHLIQALAYAEKAKWISQQENSAFSDPSLVCDILNHLRYQQSQSDESSVVTAIRTDALDMLQKAAEIDGNNIEIFNYLGNTAGEYVKTAQQDRDQLLQLQLSSYCRCIKQNCYVLQNLLKSIQLWYNNQSTLNGIFRREIKGFNNAIFLYILPQLLSKKSDLIYQILTNLGLQFPQFLITPLYCATCRVDFVQQSISRSILSQIYRSHKALLRDIVTIQYELVKIATLRAEIALDGLFSAIQGYNSSRRPLDFYNQISALIFQLSKPPLTPNEREFNAAFLEDLRAAFSSLKLGLYYDKLYQIETAKYQFTELHRRIQQFDECSFYELEYISPVLSQMHNTQIALFGQSNLDLKIVYIYPYLNVIKSKQKPRKMAFVASDGELYAYLLKGREDLRLDERIMQLFYLNNNLFKSIFALKNGMRINRYPVIPLGKTSGLIFWVPNAETIHSLIKKYREVKRVPERAEDAEFIAIAGPFYHVSLAQKIAAFKQIQNAFKAAQNDLKNALWDAAGSAEDWLRRRNAYTVTLAVMSASGYILGLGDRHPQNIMLFKHSSQILHIDFGDAFEAAQRRQKLPEKVPFRLTKMLVNAMEAAGIGGLFNSCFLESIQTFRNEKDSILAVIETFKEDQIYRDDEMYPDVVLRRIQLKLDGNEFEQSRPLTVQEQAAALIEQATNVENICQGYIGWCPFW